MNKNIYRQADSRWASLPYPKGSTFGGCGCGCCACLHVLIELDKYTNWTPKDLRPYMVNQGFAIKNQGTLWAGITKTLQHYGFSVINHPNMTSVWNTLKDRKYKFGVILFRSGTRGGVTWTTGGHYVAFVDYKIQNGKHYFYCKDSGGRHHDGWYCYETTMQGLIPQIWTANPPAGSIGGGATPVTPTPTPAPSSDKLVVDGKFGPASIKALQKKLGTTQDGKISGQLSSLKKYHPGFSSGISYGSGGSAAIKALQKLLGLSSPDGQLGPNTIKALQKSLGLSDPDGYWGPNTSKAVQKWLNGDITFKKNNVTNSITPAKAPTTSIKNKGMDISAWQGNISVANFKKAKDSGIQFVILRVGYTGSSSKKPTMDSVFENNYKNAIAAGLPVGVYFYSLATTTSLAKKEADFVVSKLKGKKITYPVYIDMEDNTTQGKASKSTLASVCNTFCNTIAAAGYKPGVYASLSWFNNKIGNITAPHSKWVAQYYKECQYKGVYDMWQYTSSGSVNGLSGKIDLNYWYNK